MTDKGHCKHGEFILREGCPQCLAEKWGKPQDTRRAERELGPEESAKGLLQSDSTTTAIVKVKPQTDEAVIALHEQSLKLEQYAVALIIASDGDVKSATNDLSIISGLKKAIEDKRKEYTQPINDHLKAVNEAFKTFTDPLNNADKVTRQKILDYRQEQERIRQEQERINQLRLEAARAEMELKGELTESVDLIEMQPGQPNHYRTDSGTLGTMKVRKYRVVDFAKLPDQYKIENSALLNKVVKAGIPEIPGVEIYTEETLRVNTRKEVET